MARRPTSGDELAEKVSKQLNLRDEVSEESDEFEEESDEVTKSGEKSDEVTESDEASSEDDDEVTESYEALDRLMSSTKEHKPIGVFYHVTKREYKAKIESDGLLKGCKAKLPRSITTGSSRDSHLFRDDSPLKGVFFCCSLFRGSLPNRSPYGEDRISIPVRSFLHHDPHLFYNSWHSITTVHYITLVLVDKCDYPQQFEYCSKHLKELTMESNDILRINRSKNECTCYHSNDFRKFKAYIEIVVVGDVRLPKWDEVGFTGRM